MVDTGQRLPFPFPARRPVLRNPFANLTRSLVGKLIVLLFVFASVPVALYGQFRQADSEKRILLLESVREQGRLIAESLRPLMGRSEPSPLIDLNAEIERFATGDTGIQVLFRPTGESGVEGFYFVATHPVIHTADLTAERDRLIERGVLAELSPSCSGERPVALRHPEPSGSGHILTSITPITNAAGCWAVITTHISSSLLGTAIDQPYWQTLEVRLATITYMGMAALTIGLFLSIWRGLMQFRELARQIRTGRAPGGGFAARNRVPELADVAVEFDRMTGALQDSAETIRLAAEDNAHAFKTPLAIIRQSLEPLKRLVPDQNPRGRRALDVIEESVDRLDHLVASAWQLDKATAEVLDPPSSDVPLTKLLERMLAAYADSFNSRGLRLVSELMPNVVVKASEDLIETVVENVIDNAIEASPPGGEIRVVLRMRRQRVMLVISDQGPGVASGDLNRIFERYISLRQPVAPSEGEDTQGGEAPKHLGIGLWIVRRNLQAVGGAVRAENRPNGGLSIIITLPNAK